ncbi:protein-glutamine gamma-glutamyltransferase [Shouchella sp. JSM 1781072]|uniref:protein-glutamine gamma-glutamyltransferase n=1 Tax=Bacillaceae TaxID=186817 RepID=UPI00159BA6EC|nr:MULTISPECIES: protein-glutamine gamma-glutamyltransferase [Bacillaceae]UTR04700.1 protein-glutamine gamma-glutamyltransferase [Alkalihalobacillus sp. LMS6]
MITIGGDPLDVTTLPALSTVETAIIQSLSAQNVTYDYSSIRDLSFELALRKHTIQASIQLLQSGARFESFMRSYCNPHYWNRMPNGAFQLKPFVSPSDAIDDIFRNGQLYGFECATAIIMIFYKAVKDSIDQQSFDQLFQQLYLYSWEHDEDLQLETRPGTDYVIGDCLYFDNPDFAPQHSVWRGENVIKLDQNLYYGHGIAIRTAEEIVYHLNRLRRPGSRRPAHLLPQVTRLNFRLVRTFSRSGYTPRTSLDSAIHVRHSGRSHLT